MVQSVSPGWTAYTRADCVAKGVTVPCWSGAAMEELGPLAIGELAPAPAANDRGVPKLVRARTPNAIRAATRSRTDEPWGGPTSPRRTCTTTARRSWAQQAAQATQAARTRRHRASRGSGRQACPRPPARGLPTMETNTTGTAVNASRAAQAAPTTSRVRCGQPRGDALATGGAD